MENDFGFEQGKGTSEVQATEENKEHLGNSTPPGEGDKQDLTDEQGKENKENDEKGNEGEKEEEKNKDSLFDKIQPGVELEIDGKIYTVDDNKNIVNDKGEIFKEADKVEEYLKSLEQSDEDVTDKLNIDSIIESVGIGITDEDGKEVSFENTPEGVKQYVDAVIETQQQEIAETTLNTLWDKYPIIKEVLDYYIANGNSLEGFNYEAPNYDIDINDNDESQQESIIRLAWKEQNRRGNVDDYIAYLKSSGKLLSVAEEELEGLKETAKEQKLAYAKKAQELAEAEKAKQLEYWTGVKEVIESKKIAGYKIPDTIIIKRDGKSIASTPLDFFNYIYQIDKEGYSRYQRDLMKEKPEDRRDDEILRAFLKYTGGTYANLVDMAINEKEVNKLRLKAKETKHKSTTIKVKSSESKQGDKIDVGY